MPKNIFLCRVTAFTILFLFVASLQAQSKNIEVLEVRNYLIKPGQRENYIDFFETRLVDTLNAKGNYVLGQFRVKNAPDNFLWLRGFEDMKAREEGYKTFYESQFWQDNKSVPLGSILNYDNVYLLQPINISKSEMETNALFDTEWFGRHKGVAVIDFYIANGKRTQLINFIKTTYDSLLHSAGVKDVSYWISHENPEDSCHHRDLLVTISFYPNESEYNAIMEKIDAGMKQETKFEMLGIVTTKTTWILEPTKRSYSGSEN